MSPRQVYNDEADYRLISHRRVGTGRPGNQELYYGYHRNHEYAWHERVADWIITQSGYDLSHIAIIGSGFPWTQEALHAHPSNSIPLGTVASQDTSPYIQAASSETPEHRAEIQRVGLDPDAGEGAVLLAQIDGGPRLSYTVEDSPISGGGGRAAVRNLCGGPPTFAYSEMVIESLFEQEILDLTDDMKTLAANASTVAHMIVTHRNNLHNFDIRTLAAWRTYFTDNGHGDVLLIDASSFETA
jgi:hypothetical protein